MKWLQILEKRMAYTSLLLLLAFCLAFAGCARKRHQSEDAETETPQQADTATVEDSPVPADQSSSSIPPADPSLAPPDTAASPAPLDAAADPQPAAPLETAVPPPPVDQATANASPSAAAVPATGSGEMGTYSVQKGDTLMKIAFNLYGDIDKWKDIYQLNKDSLQSKGKVGVGQVLKYDKPATSPVISQNGDPYLIKAGDTLGKISDDVYGQVKKWRKIYENNRQLIKDPNRIFAGFYVYYQITEEERQEAARLKTLKQPGVGATSESGSPASPSVNTSAAPVSPVGGRMPASMPPSSGTSPGAAASKN